jgi:O-glycosyl hydrolase
MFFLLLLALLCLLFLARVAAQLDVPGYVPCNPGNGGDLSSSVSRNLQGNPNQPIQVTIDTSDHHQQIRSFGASDAWSIQFVGLWPDEKREAIADLLFNSSLDATGNPQGIALTTWRFNLGAGSSRTTDISDEWRRADSFYDEDFNEYDWERLEGQRWFLQAAAARGVYDFTLFVNSPPTSMTKNGLAYPDGNSGTTNLAENKVEDFATYLADVVKQFRDIQNSPINFTHISPVNEPQWDWEGGSQEGCRYSTSDIKMVVDSLANNIDGLGSTEIEVPESGEIKDLTGGKLYIDAFFKQNSSDFIGDKVGDTVAAHSYFTDTPNSDPNSDLVRARESLREKLNVNTGLAYSMTEYCPLGSYGPGRDLGIDPALFVARVIHFDLTIAEATSWQWWLGVSPYDYKDGLVYIDDDKEGFNSNYFASKILWALGHFSRFVRPGMVRVGVNRSDGATPDEAATGLMISSYYHVAKTIVVVIFVNLENEAKNIVLDIQGTKINTMIPYVTSSIDNLTAYAAIAPTDLFNVPKRSIVTLVGYSI